MCFEQWHNKRCICVVSKKHVTELKKGRTKREERIELLLSTLSDNSVVEPSCADRIKREYLSFCENDDVVEYLKKFKPKDRLDDYLLSATEFFDLSDAMIDLFKTVFILFHSNAAVERSFSVNKQCLVENLHDKSLIAQRSVYDAIKETCQDYDTVKKTWHIRLDKLNITSSMTQYFKSSSSRRQEVLKMKANEEKNEQNERKRIAQELMILKMKKRKIEETKEDEINMLERNILYLESKIKK